MYNNYKGGNLPFNDTHGIHSKLTGVSEVLTYSRVPNPKQ